MKFLLISVAVLAICSAKEEDNSDKKHSKRGVFGLGYGSHDTIYQDSALSLGHSGLSFGYDSTPLLKSYAAPAPTYLKSYAAPAFSYASAPTISYHAQSAPFFAKSAPVFSYAAPSISYAAPAPVYAKSYAAPAPLLTKAYAAPAISYAAPAIVKSYAAPSFSYASHAPIYSAPAPVLSKIVSYAAPAQYYAKSYGAPLDLGYSGGKLW